MISKNAYAQVYYIINEMSEELRNKIPEEIRNNIDVRRNKEYKCDINEDIENMELLEDTKKLLSVLYTDYIASKEEKEFILDKEKAVKNK